MNTLSRFADALSMLADSGMDPIAAASLTELRTAIVARSRSVTVDTPPEQIIVIVNLIEDLETLLDRLAAEHQARELEPDLIDSINTIADDVAA
jgi:hypothetical protein